MEQTRITQNRDLLEVTKGLSEGDQVVLRPQKIDLLDSLVVNHGRVTLEGVVQSNVERMLARSLASGFGAFDVKNDLKTDAEVRESMEVRKSN